MSEFLPSVGFIAAIILILGIIVIFIALKSKKEGRYKEPNYYVFFTLGICFLGSGSVFMITSSNPGFMGITCLGIVYMIIGLYHRDKWGN